MIVRNSLLAVLASQSTHGYGLKSTFEASTAGAWTLNAGQVYTTLSRLERDGLVEASEGGEDEAEAPERRAWRITEEGRRILEAWYAAPVGETSSRDELVIKILVAVATGAPDIEKVLQTQRASALSRLQGYTRRKMEVAPETAALPGLLMLDALILRAEAEVRWLDLCEQRLGQRAAGRPS